jgi:hypothetical protein
MPNIPPQGLVDLSPNAEKTRFIEAERTQESDGDYQVVNPSSGALGAYQVLPSNLPGWLPESGLPQMSPYDYLHNPSAQDQLAWHILGGYYDRYGAPGAAAMWYSGQPNPNENYGDPPVWQYVDDVLALMSNSSFPVNYGTAPGGPAFNLPAPAETDWSGTVNAAAMAAHNFSRAAMSNGYLIGALR